MSCTENIALIKAVAGGLALHGRRGSKLCCHENAYYLCWLFLPPPARMNLSARMPIVGTYK